MGILLLVLVGESGGRGDAVGVAGEEPEFVDVVEVGGELIVILRGERVVFVVVAAGAFEGEAHEG